jgi:hypothetical protein
MTKNLEANVETISTNVVAKKRGRKSKKEIEESQKNENNKTIFLNVKNNENIVVNIEENDNMSKNDNIIDEIIHSDDDDDENNNNNLLNEKNVCENKPIAKKRGRKPNGGKIIQQIIPLNNNKETKPNVILHLKCSLKDLQNNSLYGLNVDGFNFTSQNNFYCDSLSNKDENIDLNDYSNISAKICDYDCDTQTSIDNYQCENKISDNDIRDIWKKIKILEHKLHINCIDNKKSACFWDTCEFDNPPIYIPKHFINDTYQVYGCFCSPECAVAYLMEENIDSSIKFERYHLMNHIYSKVYDYTKNIKPSPNPHYMLEKYYGNLTIQEYRSLLRNERLFLVVDKPLTRIMPELHEDNDDFIINNKIIPSNTYQIKKKIQKKQTKTNILSERFGLTQN